MPKLNRKGEKNPKSKLTEKEVRAIVALHNFGMTQAAIARSTKVSFSTIADILNGLTWNEVTGIPKPVTNAVTNAQKAFARFQKQNIQI